MSPRAEAFEGQTRRRIIWIMVISVAVATTILLIFSSVKVHAVEAEAHDQAAAVPNEVVPTISATPIAVMVGDSYFGGWGLVKQQDALGYATAKKLGFAPMILGAGASGYLRPRPERLGPPRTGFAGQLQDDPITTVRPAALVVLQGGLADIREPSDAVFDAVVATIRLAKQQQPSARIIMLGPANVYPTAENLITDDEALQRRAAEQESIEYISMEELMPHAEFLSYLSADGTHPTAEGNRILVERFVSKLTEMGATPALLQ